MANATQVSVQIDLDIGAWWFHCPRCGARPGERCDVGMLRRQGIYELSYHAPRTDKANNARRMAHLDAVNACDGIGATDRLSRFLRHAKGREAPRPDDDPRMALTRKRRLRTAEMKAELDRVEIVGNEAWPPYSEGGTVYRCYGRPPAEGEPAELIYIGKAYAGLVRSRLREHARKHWWLLVHVVTLTSFDFFMHAESAEVNAIKKERPLANIAHTTPPEVAL